MQELIDNPLTVSPKHVENWKQVSETQMYMLNRNFVYVCDLWPKYMLIYSVILVSYMDVFSGSSTCGVFPSSYTINGRIIMNGEF